MVATPDFDCTIHSHLAVLDHPLGFPAAARHASDFQERPQWEGTADDYLDQLLRRIGMMR